MGTLFSSVTKSFLQNDTCVCIVEGSDFFKTIATKVPSNLCNATCHGNPKQNCGSDYGLTTLININNIHYESTELKDTCLDYFMMGVIPNPGECIDVQDNSGTILNCCWYNIDRAQVRCI